MKSVSLPDKKLRSFDGAKKLLFFSLLTLAFFFTFSAQAAPMCSALFETSAVPAVEKVNMTEQEFNQTTGDLRSTLSGKLATVWRSEWKTKLSFLESNAYVAEMAQKLLTSETRKLVLNGLQVDQEGFTQKVHARIYDLQTQNKIQTHDDLMVRDKPAPQGAKDTTFTYYTKPIVVENAEGKHQMRVRTYLREIMYTQMPVGSQIQGFDAAGNNVEFSRVSNTTFKITLKNGEVVQSEQTLNLSEMQNRFGKSAHIFAPHGKSFKLEVKTALNDIISDQKFPLLGGNHMVQKLDVSLTPAQVSKLFAPFNNADIKTKRDLSLSRIEAIMTEINTKNPENTARTTAVFNILKAGVRQNPDFLVIEGATFYHRTAFESKSGFQTTIDREQGVFAGQMYSDLSLKSPIEVVRKNNMLKPRFEDARHVELKVPVTSLQNTVGIDFQDPAKAPQPQNIDKEPQITKALSIYHGYVKNAKHAGKFNFIRKTGDLTNELTEALENTEAAATIDPQYLSRPQSFNIIFEHSPQQILKQSINLASSQNYTQIPHILKLVQEKGSKNLTPEQYTTLKQVRKNLAVARSALQIVDKNHTVPENFSEFVRDLGHLNDYISFGKSNKSKKLSIKLLASFQSIDFAKIESDTKISTEQSIKEYYRDLKSQSLTLLKQKQLSVHEYHQVRKNLKEFLTLYYLNKDLDPESQVTPEFSYLNTLNDNLGIFNDHYTQQMLKQKNFTKDSKITFPKELKQQVEYFFNHLNL